MEDDPPAIASTAEPRSAWRLRLQAPTIPAGPVLASRTARRMVVAGVILFVAYFAISGCLEHDRWNTYSFDLGIFDQGTWLLSRFRSPFVTLIGRNLFGDHTSFLLVPLVPFYWLAPTAKTLIVLQAVALAVSAWPAFLIARDLTRDERIGAALTAAWLLHPALGWSAAEQFHPDGFAVPLLTFALWFMLRRRWVGFTVCVGIALLVKEDVAFLTVVLGLYVTVRYSRRVGLAVAAASAGYFAFAVLVVLRHFNGVGSLNGWRIPFGGLGGLLQTVFTHPGTLIHHAVSEGRPWYLLQLLAPLAFAPLLAPGILVIAIGPLVSNVLSTFAYQHQIEHHYGTLIVPVLLLATAVAVGRVVTPRMRTAVTSAVVIAAIATALVWGPLFFRPRFGGEADAPPTAAIRAALEVVPPNASVAAYYRFTPHLAHRAEIYDLPNPFSASYWGVGVESGERLAAADTVEYVVVPEAVLHESAYWRVRREVATSFETVFDRDGMLVLHRVESP